MASSTPSVKRRSSARAMPGPPKQMWYCSVSLAWKANRGSSSGSPSGRVRCAPAEGLSRRAGSSTILVLEMPAAATTRFGPV